jgi:hypothetical protein
LNDPINNKVDPRQFVFVNYLDLTGKKQLVKDNSENVITSTSPNGYYCSAKENRVCGSNLTYTVNSNNKAVDSIQFKYVDKTKDYVLYYVNAYGGWDSLLINGNVKRIDNITPFTYRNKQRGKVKYMNEITPT